MGRKLGEYVAQVEAEASAESRAELDAFRAHHRLARQFRELRRVRGLSQAEVAALMGVDQAEVSRLERAQGNPTEQTLQRAAFALGARLELVPDDPVTAPA